MKARHPSKRPWNAMASSYWSLVGCRPLGRQYPGHCNFKLAWDNVKERLSSKRPWNMMASSCFLYVSIHNIIGSKSTWLVCVRAKLVIAITKCQRARQSKAEGWKNWAVQVLRLALSFYYLKTKINWNISACTLFVKTIRT